MIDTRQCIATPIRDCISEEEMKKNQDRWSRDEKRDIKRAVDLFYRFQKNLQELHPKASSVIYTMVNQCGF
jgi:hypothetical protein